MIDVIIFGTILAFVYSIFQEYLNSLFILIIKGIFVGIGYWIINSILMWAGVEEGTSFLVSLGILFVISFFYDILLEPIVNIILKGIQFLISGVIIYYLVKWIYHYWYIFLLVGISGTILFWMYFGANAHM